MYPAGVGVGEIGLMNEDTIVTYYIPRSGSV